MSVAALTRQQFLDDVVHSVGVTFLATEMRCLKCHDHKFDPMPTLDYYRMQAIFAPVQFADRTVPFQRVENTDGLKAGLARMQKLVKDGGIELVVPEGATEKQKQEAGLGVAKVKNKQGQIRRRALNRFKPLALSVYNGPPAQYVSNKPLNPMPKQRQGNVQDVFVLASGSLESPLEKVTPGVLSVLPESNTRISKTSWNTIPDTMHGRRRTLARWIADEKNPLTARVIVNRVWQWHFGRGLAGNPNNFGKMGGRPTHPELLDWLARRFMEQGWSFKALHRLIVLSDVYQRSGDAPEPSRAAAVDPENKLLSWFPPRRLSAEELRDGMLLVSGELNRTLGGVAIRPEINRDVAFQPRHVMGSVAPAYQPSRTPAQRNRRTIYALKIRTLRDPFLEVFDQPTPDLSCERRTASTVTPQVFALFNSPNVADRALAMAARLQQTANTPQEQIEAAFRGAFGRAPSDAEYKQASAHVAKMTQHHRTHAPLVVEPPQSIIREMVEEMTGLTFQWKEQLDVYQNYVPGVRPWNVSPETRGLAELCLVLFNANEFAYVY